ncbi:MAG TPA: DUF952 domain-containing protein [Actinopolymorphaceae bacterium]
MIGTRPSRAARTGSRLAGATLDDVGLIHASAPGQLRTVAEFAYASCEDALVVLVMDDDAIRATGTPVRYEDGGDGELYPHIYGPIRTAFVTGILPAGFDSDGHFTF